MTSDRTTAFILAGGYGTRLQPVLPGTPKVLAPVAGRPFLDSLLRMLSRGAGHVVLCTGYGAEEVAAYCGDGSRWGIEIEYSVEHSPLGTGGAIRQALPLARSDPFLVLNGDTYVDLDVAELTQFHQERGAALTMLLKQVEAGARYGSVAVAADGRVLGFDEKVDSRDVWINAGSYALDKRLAMTMPEATAVSFEREVIPGLLGGPLYGMPYRGPFIDIGTPESYEQASEFLAALGDQAG